MCHMLNKSECRECTLVPKKVAVSGGSSVVPNSFQFSFFEWPEFPSWTRPKLKITRFRDSLLGLPM